MLRLLKDWNVQEDNRRGCARATFADRIIKAEDIFLTLNIITW